MKGTFAEKMGESNQIPSSSLLPNRTDVDSDETNTEFTYIMQARHACQHGFVDQVKQLLDSGLVLPNSIDQDDCSLLHWAAINNHIEIAKLLVARKCNVNAVGGVLSATPLHWAARHGHTKMVALLIRNGADSTMRDVEGFTPLHIAIQCGCIPVAAYLIAAGQSSDELDGSRMTPAIWAACKVYSSDALFMLARLGADLERPDMTHRNTPLHWAVIHRNHAAITALCKLEVDLLQQNKEKETPFDIARRQNDHLSVKLLDKALRQRRLISLPLKQKLKEDKIIAQRFIFCLPYFIIFLGAIVLDVNLNLVTKIPLLLIIFPTSYYVFWFFAKERLDFAFRTFLFGLCSASKIFIILSWLIYVHPVVPWHMQIEFLLGLVSIPILFYIVCTSDPGFINVTHKERCKMIIAMTEETSWKGNFCSTCVITRPIRSKHCSVCDRCVLVFDHHCPWIANCVGGKNHRIFVIYLIGLNSSCILVFIGCFFYWKNTCGQISLPNMILCKPWVLVLQTMALFYAIFLTALTLIQAYQILIAMTTNERMNLYRYRHFHADGDGSIRNPFTRGCINNLYNFWCKPPDETETKPQV